MLAVIDPRMPAEARATLNRLCEVVELPPFSLLDERVASHPDMLMFRLESKLFVCTDYYREASEAIKKIISKSGLELILTDDLLKSRYPYDVKFNETVAKEYKTDFDDCFAQQCTNIASTF